ncbi:Erythronate-4-phosphate dehydrogenase family protein [Abeliophyllum distichum]|uniref:Erythronate-4-phosphate dehydrogenase family protein n=1 Tax=Abeliophyllum distichum TaxID=126358 RepID=A0ABD1TJZ1_9LAMI
MIKNSLEVCVYGTFGCSGICGLRSCGSIDVPEGVWCEISSRKKENSYEMHSNGNVKDPGLQIIRHPSYQSSSKFSLPWFDIRVFYVRISNFRVDDSTPEFLTLHHIPLIPDTLLEVNGVRCSIESERVSCLLRRNRVDKKSEEATFVGTDSIRLNGSSRFEVFNKEELMLSGILEMSHANGSIGESNNLARWWSMNCESVMTAGTGFLKGKHIMVAESSSPTVEVYVAGCFSGTPIILTKTLQLNHAKKHKKGMLDMIPECESSDSHEDVASGHDLQVAEYRNYKPESEEDYDNLYWRRPEYIDGEDGELSWFNAGVRVGVGIGLGICLGIGIGVEAILEQLRHGMVDFQIAFSQVPSVSSRCPQNAPPAVFLTSITHKFFDRIGRSL